MAGSLKVILAATLVILETGCGLPNPYFLAAPSANIVTGATNIATFTSPGYAAGSNFTGFEVYYKFYSSTPGQSDLNLGGGGTTGPTALYGFSPITLLTDSAPYSRTTPLIQPASGDIPNGITVSLTFSSGSASTYSYTGGAVSPTAPVQIGRFLSNNQQPLTGSRSFQPGLSSPANYTQYDTDVSSVFFQCQINGFSYILLYALSFGMNGTTPEYSVPVCLGYVQLSFP